MAIDIKPVIPTPPPPVVRKVEPREQPRREERGRRRVPDLEIPGEPQAHIDDYA